MNKIISEKRQTHPIEKIVIVGNANVGKSAIFGLLTGKYVTVSNYPGTTVEVTQGNMRLDSKRLLLIDTPGINSLIPMSEDEKVTRDILLKESPVAIIQVGDAKNLKRTILITLQLIETGLPFVLDLNMVDEAMDRGITINTQRLSEILGIDVVKTIASQKKGIGELKESILKTRKPSLKVDYGPIIEEYINKISKLLPTANISKRSISIMILCEDNSLKEWLKANVKTETISMIEFLVKECKLKVGDSIHYLISKIRMEKAEEITKAVITKVKREQSQFLQEIGKISMHPVFGIPFLLIVLFALYQFVGVFGAGILVDFFEETIFGEYINPTATKIIKAIVPLEIIQELLIGEYGLITVALTYSIAIILPITSTFFIAFALLEDSGYLPRLAILSNRLFNFIGLNGKAILPLVLGLGCGTMAVMTARILETKRDRIITTFLLALAIPCSAQLGVILGMLGSISFKATLIWLFSLLLIALLAGFLASKLVSGNRTDFFLEIPPLRLPHLKNILIKTVGRIEWYLKEAVPLFILGTLILFILNKLEILIIIERLTSPIIVSMLELPPKTTEAFIVGFLRRDYGAAGLYAMAEQGLLTPVQILVGLVTITLFVPCLANFFMIIKERGIKTALWIVVIVFTTAILYGSLLNWFLRYFEINL
ncbi:MAG: ferrous iron transport protein B [Thermodesulfovibrionales bacterium]|nr:ferrous iron transport protein B [Thermodesulfovibrionales bacterium]